MKTRILIAIAVGAFISVLLALLGAATSMSWQYLMAPGIMAVMLIWGPHGPAPSDAIVLAVVVSVNAIVYGLITFGLVNGFRKAFKA
jgi:hypothetical protein